MALESILRDDGTLVYTPQGQSAADVHGSIQGAASISRTATTTRR